MSSKSLVFEFSLRAVRTFYTCVLALDFVLLWVFFALTSQSHLSWLQQILRRQVDFTIESVAAVWYSGIILFLTGIAAVLCFKIDSRNISLQKSQRIIRYGWIPVAFAFGFFSLDEMGSIHERLDKILPVIILSLTGGKTGWVTVLWPLMIVVFGYFVCFFWFYLSKYRPSQILALIGGSLLISVPVQEKLKHFIYAGGGKRQAYLSVLEEGSELIGTTLILIAFLEFALFLSHMERKNVESEPLRSAQPTIRIVFGPQFITCFYVLLPLLALSSFLTALFFVSGLEDLRYRGDPSAWYPSAALFLAAVFGFLLMARHSGKSVGRLLWAALGITALWFSVDSQAGLADLSVKYLEKIGSLSGFNGRESADRWLAVTIANTSLFAAVWRVNPRNTRLSHGLLIAAALGSAGLFLSQSPLIARESLRVLAPTGLVIFLTEALRSPRRP
jgi:hypothetical protein